MENVVCVHCGNPAGSVYVEYSPGNIRLSTCARCCSTVDEYVECEAMIVIIDMILHKPEAYRHVFFNYPKLHHLNLLHLMRKATLLYLLLDICRWAFQSNGKEKKIQWDSFTCFVLSSGKVLTQVACVNAIFFVTLSATSHSLARTQKRAAPDVRLTWGKVLLSILLSSHFKMFFFAMLVWEFSPLMTFMVDILVYSSNTIALKVMLKHDHGPCYYGGFQWCCVEDRNRDTGGPVHTGIFHMEVKETV